ncbi:radical SAM protein [Clostridia bacterium]|nr:radical SAM protein [Clostridia bacterium]
MKIGLLSDAVNFPSIPLMKLSAHHKARGDTVKLIDDFSEHFDVAYCSKSFNLPLIKKIPTLPRLPLADKVFSGGTGFAIETSDGKERYDKLNDGALPAEVEHSYPDYGLYPELTKGTAFGFLTRGCPNACPFCVVSGKEGLCSLQTAELSEFWRGQRKIKLMDANLLACKDRERLIRQLAESSAEINFVQGLDARFVDSDIAEILCKCQIGAAHFAFDLIKNERAIIRGLELFRAAFKGNERALKVYILTNYNTDHAEDWYRVKRVMELGYQPDVRIYQKGTHDRFLTDLARWANNRRLYRACRFEDYVPRVDGLRCRELYGDIIGKGT